MKLSELLKYLNALQSYGHDFGFNLDFEVSPLGLVLVAHTLPDDGHRAARVVGLAEVCSARHLPSLLEHNMRGLFETFADRTSRSSVKESPG
jgi:hypothetical protein